MSANENRSRQEATVVAQTPYIWAAVSLAYVPHVYATDSAIGIRKNFSLVACAYSRVAILGFVIYLWIW